MVNTLQYKILLNINIALNALCKHADGWEIFNVYFDKKSRVGEKIHNNEY